MEYQDTRDALNGTQGRRQVEYTFLVCNVRTPNGKCDAFFKDGQVHVWDSVARHYTTCHNLTSGQVRYVKSRANRDK